ncbi:MAG: hypothetical protein IJN81_02695 [Clostridia bacterium]|nr:hypothetical protein [Clostridia bacterium]
MNDKTKITKELLEKFISDSSTELDLAEVEAFMDSEIEKPEDEMDTELIDMCATVLAKAYNSGFNKDEQPEMYRPWEEKSKPVKRSVRFKHVVAAAAILVLVCVIALSAGAKLFDSPSLPIRFYANYFRLMLNNDEPTTEAPNGTQAPTPPDNLDAFMLPEALLSDEYEKQIKTEQDETMITTWISVNNTQANITGLVTITQFKSTDHDMTNGQVNVPDNTYRNLKQLTIDGKEIVVFNNEEKSYINYSDDTTNYQISLNCDFDTMVSIAETINVKE